MIREPTYLEVVTGQTGGVHANGVANGTAGGENKTSDI